jgi:ATP-dependent Clp protease ATP-binding subunit ClpB
MIRFEKFTVKCQEALQAAQAHASELRHSELQPEHLLLALLEQKDGVVLPVLERLSVDIPRIEKDIRTALDKLPRLETAADVRLSRDLSRVLEAAQDETAQFKDEYVSTEHMLIALATAKGQGPALLLGAHGVTREAILKALVSIRGSQKITDPNPEQKYQALERYSRDLTALAGAGKLDPVIGREEEIRRIIQVLSRRTKNNPVLIGEPGVGKTAIVECEPRRSPSR